MCFAISKNSFPDRTLIRLKFISTVAGIPCTCPCPAFTQKFNRQCESRWTEFLCKGRAWTCTWDARDGRDELQADQGSIREGVFGNREAHSRRPDGRSVPTATTGVLLRAAECSR